MRRIRLHVEMPLAAPGERELPEAAARHAVRVLRLVPGQELILFNGDGCDYHATLERIEGHHVHVRLQSSRPVDNEPPWPVILVQCLAKGDKMDLVMQKATELGATRIVPAGSERSEVRLDARRADKRQRHWQAIVAAACEQCGRARLPVVEPVQSLSAWLQDESARDMLRLALVPAATARVRELRVPPSGIVLVIGPEGGLGERDLEALRSAGYAGLSLGPRVLRTETAGLAALTAIQACHGDC